MTEKEIRERIRSIEDSTDHPEEHQIELEMLYEWLDDIKKCDHVFDMEAGPGAPLCSKCEMQQES